MIDASLDPDFAALERADSQRASAPVRRRAPATLATLPPEPSFRRNELTEEVPAGTVAVPMETADPLGHLQTARIGFALAAILVLYLLWSRRRGHL